MENKKKGCYAFAQQPYLLGKRYRQKPNASFAFASRQRLWILLIYLASDLFGE